MTMTGVPKAIDSLDELAFENRFTSSLPADPSLSTGRRQVAGAAYSRVAPTPVALPRTLAVSDEVAALLGLSSSLVESDDFAAVFAGNRIPVGADPFAMCYGGHQFGNWAGQLGDGRAIALGEVIDVDGGHQTLQLKGAGPTPYSRTADGRAVLRSSIREFLCSEAMHHLGVPTTRALSLVATGEAVVRDVLYDGHPRPEPGAVVCRVAPSFVRFGNFQLPASRGEADLLRQLVTFTIAADFPHLCADDVAGWFSEVCTRTAELIVHWMRVGFVHGVMNTDNMSILGLTIDYGPYGWLESFDPDWTPNTTDAGMRRYRFGTQPQIAHWNLLQLARALVPLIESPEGLQAGLDLYRTTYESSFASMCAARLGLGAPQPADEALVADLLELLTLTETDNVIFHRQLASVPVSPDTSDDDLLAPLHDAYYRPDELCGETRDATVRWLRRWGARARLGGLSDADRVRRMNSLNPRFVLRNYLAQEAIDLAEAGDPSLMAELLDVLRRPYDDQPGRERFAARRPEWARTRVGCSMLSCSS
jgi:uncharacterized protein YdiU (UPF0061 family)